MNSIKRAVSFAVCFATISGQFPPVLAEVQQNASWSKTLGITGKQTGPFRITARVSGKGRVNVPFNEQQPLETYKGPGAAAPTGQGQEKVSPDQVTPSDGTGKTAPSSPVTQDQLASVMKTFTDTMTKQQKELTDKLTAAQQQESAATKASLSNLAAAQANQAAQNNATVNALAQQQANQTAQMNAAMANLTRQQGANQQTLVTQLRNQQQQFLRQAFAQTQRDRMMRDFQRRLLADDLFNNRMGPYGAGYGPNGMSPWMSMLGGMLGGLGGSALGALANRPQSDQGAGQGERMPSAEEIASKLQQMSSADKLPDEVSRRVMDALRSSSQQLAADRNMEQEIDRFAGLNDRIARIADKLSTSPSQSAYRRTPFAFNSDDYARLASIAEQMPDSASRQEFLELAMEAAGRVSVNKQLPVTRRKQARDFALTLTPKFAAIRTSLPPMAARTNDLQYDIDKCLMISSAKGFYM